MFNKLASIPNNHFYDFGHIVQNFQKPLRPVCWKSKPDLSSTPKFIAMAIMILVMPKAAANHELFFNKPLAATLGVRKFIPIFSMNLVTLCCAAYVRPRRSKTHLCFSHLFYYYFFKAIFWCLLHLRSQKCIIWLFTIFLFCFLPLPNPPTTCYCNYSSSIGTFLTFRNVRSGRHEEWKQAGPGQEAAYGGRPRADKGRLRCRQAETEQQRQQRKQIRRTGNSGTNLL